MSTSLLKLVRYLLENRHSHKCKDCKSKLDYRSFEDDQLIFRCFESKKNYEQDFNKDLNNRFPNKYRFCNEDMNKLVLLLRRAFYPYEHMIAGKDLMKQQLTKKLFTSNYIYKTSLIKTTQMLKKYFKNLN